MEHISDGQPTIAFPEPTAFAVWLGRALKTCHEGAVHEPIPAQLLALLPPPEKDR